MMVYSRTKGLEGDKWELYGNRTDAVLPAPAQDAESGRVMGKSVDKGKWRRKRKGSPKTSFEAVLNGDPAGFVIGLRMMLELLQGQERRVTGGANMHVSVFRR